MNLAVHFEIPVTDLERAIAFYEAVFELKLERIVIDGHPMALFPLQEEQEGCSGALAQGDSYVPSLNGTRVYLAVADLDQALVRAVAAGAAILYPATQVGEQFRVAECCDSEGNRIALQQRL